MSVNLYCCEVFSKILAPTDRLVMVLAVDHVEQRAQQGPRLKSLVICPPTLADHWGYEIAKYLSPETLSARVIYGLPQQRAALLQQASGHDVIIMSYESVRADIETLKLQHWNYLILDEGHIIRSPKSKITQVLVYPRDCTSDVPILTAEQAHFSFCFHRYFDMQDCMLESICTLSFCNHRSCCKHDQRLDRKSTALQRPQ